MTKVIASFNISETLDDINFVVTADGENYARMKGKTGITSYNSKTIRFLTEFGIRVMSLDSALKNPSYFAKLQIVSTVLPKTSAFRKSKQTAFRNSRRRHNSFQRSTNASRWTEKN